MRSFEQHQPSPDLHRHYPPCQTPPLPPLQRSPDHQEVVRRSRNPLPCPRRSHCPRRQYRHALAQRTPYRMGSMELPAHRCLQDARRRTAKTREENGQAPGARTTTEGVIVSRLHRPMQEPRRSSVCRRGLRFHARILRVVLLGLGNFGTPPSFLRGWRPQCTDRPATCDGRFWTVPCGRSRVVRVHCERSCVERLLWGARWLAVRLADYCGLTLCERFVTLACRAVSAAVRLTERVAYVWRRARRASA